MLKLKELYKTYNKEKANEVKALNGVSLDVKEGEMLCILGKSGCGKSTLLHIIGGLDKPTSGEVIIDSVNITNMEEKELSLYRRKNIGFVFQSYNLVPELTVKENIIFPSLLENKNYDKKYYDFLIEALDIENRVSHLPGECSGGQQQRAAIARALINRPKLILCDEPTGNLDYESSEKVKKSLLEIHKKYKPTLIIVTHDNDFLKLCERNIVLQDGMIKKDEMQ